MREKFPTGFKAGDCGRDREENSTGRAVGDAGSAQFRLTGQRL
jgi:hypothetical protein